MLNKEKIEEIKKKINVRYIDEEIIEKNKWININHIYMKVNRSIYEDLLIYSYSINFLEKIDDNEIKDLLKKNINIIEEANEYITDYKIGQKWRLETLGAKFFEENVKEINYVVELVFGHLLKEEEEGIDEID